MNPSPPNTATGVEYFELPDLMPGRPMFRCVRLSASLQVSRCSAMWALANEAADSGSSCLGCKVGAAHAGVGDPSQHWLRGSGACSRCHRTDLRLIGGNVCVGCKNREYEWVKGRNAKGKFPAFHPTLAPRCVVVSVGGKTQRVARSLTASTTELVVELLRDRSGRVLFGQGSGRLHAAG